MVNIRYTIIWILVILSSSISGGPFADNGNGTLTDSGTNLVWQKCSAGQGTTLGNCSTGTILKFTWNDAISYCNGLTLGNRNWRLPNINELVSSLDYISYSNISINSNNFPNIHNPSDNSIYWSSTTSGRSTQSALTIYFSSIYFGVTGNFLKSENIGYVRCVSGP